MCLATEPNGDACDNRDHGITIRPNHVRQCGSDIKPGVLEKPLISG